MEMLSRNLDHNIISFIKETRLLEDKKGIIFDLFSKYSKIFENIMKEVDEF